jgi:hypothetical protein
MKGALFELVAAEREAGRPRNSWNDLVCNADIDGYGLAEWLRSK